LFWARPINFWQSYAPWTLKNSNNFLFLCIFFALVAHMEIKVWYTDLSLEYLGQVLFWVLFSNFWQSYTPWTSKNSNNLQFPFNFFALVAHIQMKFGIQIFQKNI
jgi:hypothetical protein